MSGVKRVRDPKVLDRLTAKTREVLRARAFALRDEVSGVLEESKVGSGRQYVRRDGRVHPASAPLDPPARETGKLINSIQANEVTPELYEVGPAEASFTDEPAGSDGQKYPVYLEFGTRRMENRPYMRPAVARFKRKVKEGGTP